MDPRVKKAYDFLRRRFREKIDLNKLADTVGISPFHLQRLYKAQMKESPVKSLVRIRLERARHLLVLDPVKPIGTIAVDCGFRSPQAFSRAFTQRFGRSPRSIADELKKAPKSSDTSLKVTIRFVAKMYVVYEHTSVTASCLDDDFRRARARCSRAGLPDDGESVGVLTHEALHQASRGLNYYAGVEISAVDKDSFPTENLYVIPQGFYASFVAEFDQLNIRFDLRKFKTQWLDMSGYKVADVFAFETFAEGKAVGVGREIHIPVIKGR